MTTTVTGLYRSAKAAEAGLQALLAAGYDRKQISVVMRDTPYADEIVHEETADVRRGAITGAFIGGGLAALAAGALALPVLGVIAAGPLLASLAGGGAGAVAGSALGALVGAGTGSTVAGEYMAHIEHGEVLLGVDTDRAHAYKVRRLFIASGAHDVSDAVHAPGHKHEPQHDMGDAQA